jgi:nucleoside-diphosphate-sugar epimerase
MRNLDRIRAEFRTFEINFLSSWFVYGDAQKPPFKESGPCQPKGFYSISKLSAEMYLRSYCETFGIQYRIIRLANVFGPNDKGVSQKKNALQFLISQIKSNKDIDLYHGGDFYRDYIDVRDVVSALDLLIEDSPTNQIYNVGSGTSHRFLDLLELVRISAKSTSNFHTVEPPEFHRLVQVKDSWLDTTKIKNLGFNIQYPIMREVCDL